MKESDFAQCGKRINQLMRRGMFSNARYELETLIDQWDEESGRRIYHTLNKAKQVQVTQAATSGLVKDVVGYAIPVTQYKNYIVNWLFPEQWETTQMTTSKKKQISKMFKQAAWLPAVWGVHKIWQGQKSQEQPKSFKYKTMLALTGTGLFKWLGNLAVDRIINFVENKTGVIKMEEEGIWYMRGLLKQLDTTHTDVDAIHLYQLAAAFLCARWKALKTLKTSDHKVAGADKLFQVHEEIKQQLKRLPVKLQTCM